MQGINPLALYNGNHFCSTNWASEASPTPVCSIEISGDIHMSVGRSVCRSCTKMRRQNYLRACSKSFWAVKTDL